VRLPQLAGHTPVQKSTIGVKIEAMRVAMATIVALLILRFTDEHLNDARYTRAAAAMLKSSGHSARPPQLAAAFNRHRAGLPFFIV